MRACRWFLALIATLSAPAAAVAVAPARSTRPAPDQPAPDQPAPHQPAPDRPAELPPLLKPPAELPPLLKPPADTPQAPPVSAPRGPVADYDHHHLYLPRELPRVGPRPPETCRPLGRWWVNPALELAWTATHPVSGPVRLQPATPAGRLPGLVLASGGHTPDDFRPGFSLGVGRFLGDTHTHALDANLFFTSDGARTLDGFAPGLLVTFPAGSGRSPPRLLAVPPPLDRHLVGTFPATLASRFLAADTNYRHNLLCTPTGRLDALTGYRFAHLQDELYLGEPHEPGRGEYRWNRLTASNPFHGGQVGLAGEYRGRKWYLGATATTAFGAVFPDVSATGLFVTAQAVEGSRFARLAALTAPNRTWFAVLPSVSLVTGRAFGEHLRVFTGYSFRYLSRATRLGEVLNPAVTSVPVDDFWVQSLSLGLELRY